MEAYCSEMINVVHLQNISYFLDVVIVLMLQCELTFFLEQLYNLFKRLTAISTVFCTSNEYETTIRFHQGAIKRDSKKLKLS